MFHISFTENNNGDPSKTFLFFLRCIKNMFHISFSEKMPTYAKGHTQNRSSLCCLCLRKQKDLRKISCEYEKLIHDLVSDNFSVSNDKIPDVICKSCILALTDNKKVRIKKY